MFVVTVDFVIKDEAIDAFLPAMLKNAKASLEDEPGCSHFDVCFDPKQPSHCFLYEIYDDEAAFKVHLATDHFKSFDAEVADMLVSKSPRIWERVLGDRVLGDNT
jgi:autoinducer 2-degrading protein